ncbi:MAG TPA: transcription-repair coupling factor [Gammaproteobacteria bacterium]|nr:transcription-repair coupling factor [Gammaproteobacteria bacterium]HIL62013.1 transcription-repair coupling factor [Porticoccaceae bacterium]|tara:strand:- start:5670 stop:9119 length:3450 start_codon:yes stop_codon:yes gene_type:complete
MPNIFDPPLPQGSNIAYWKQLHGTAVSLAISNAAANCEGPLLVVCEDNEAAGRLKRELKYFCKAKANLDVFSLPDWETLPYDIFSPHQDIISDRLRTLYHMPQLRTGIIVVSVTSLMHKLPPKAYIAANSFNLEIGQLLHIDTMRSQLISAGYQSVSSVYEHGEFAVRGSIIDIFPMGSVQPFRIDLFDDEIETLQNFDPETQRSNNRVDSIRLLPGREFPLDKKGIATFRGKFRDLFDVDVRQCPIYQDVSDGISSPGLEYYLDLFFDGLSSLFDYLPASTRCCKVGNLNAAGEKFWQDIGSRYADREVDRLRPILRPDQIFIAIDFVQAALKRYPQIEFKDSSAAADFKTTELPDLSSNPKLSKPFSNVQQFVAQSKQRVLFCAESAGRRETLLEILKQLDIFPRSFEHWQDFLHAETAIGITIAPLDQGLWLAQENLVLITEAQLFGNRIAQRRRRHRQQDNTEFIIRSLTELHLDDAVVHVDHGIGRYRGLQTITTDGQTTEFLSLEYAANAKLYVPVASLHLISRYSGADSEAAPLNRLGTDQWQKTRRKAAEKIRDVAAELLDIYSQREAREGFKYRCEADGYGQFAASFPFEETADQASAIEAVIADMGSGRTLDRLICGDVGFGKTEVAMRAAFVAVQNSKQVALLVPTTLLAQQHYESFKDRFADWPFVVDVISRFKSATEQTSSLQNVAAGKVDILIGTHKLLHANIDYHDLGLLIIDEEHRFGVRQKEKLKSLRANVDILTLTATPIPRTLNMALSGIRDLSLIVTPPTGRLSVKTFVRGHQDSLIKEAVSRELMRGGQMFYLHNEVKTIDRAAEHLRQINPQARICIAHGQMPERELEKVMADFYHKRYNILVCTTIIETGIDIPSANTILINRADKFGLAQLHQLRGRVGRSHHQAYAYLLLPSHGKLGADARKRIEAIQAATTLGAGFTLASHDLEIRGAGELLGEEQSGHMQKIGFSLYTEMLEAAVAAIKAGKTPSLELNMDKSIEVNLRIPALIPEDYLPDVHTRLIMYKRISSSLDIEDLRELQVEIIDRFGLLPKQLKLLFQLTQLKLRALTFGIKKIDANVNSGRIEFGPQTRVDPGSIVQLIQAEPKSYKLGGANQLQFVHACSEAQEKLQFIDDLLDKLKLAEQKAA